LDPDCCKIWGKARGSINCVYYARKQSTSMYPLPYVNSYAKFSCIVLFLNSSALEPCFTYPGMLQVYITVQIIK